MAIGSVRKVSRLRPIGWRRRGDGLLGGGRAISEIAGLYRAEQPDLVHHIALKPVLFGGIARRLASAGAAKFSGRDRFGNGPGFRFFGRELRREVRRPSLGIALRLAAGRDRGWVIVQNPEDRDALIALGTAPSTDCDDQGVGGRL